jgi:CBS-domain-containing membrane protein
LVAESPALHRSKIYNIIGGHSIGLMLGFAVLFLLNAYNDPTLFGDHTLTLGRVLASAIAVGLTIGVAYFARASHPPAGATALLVALGGIGTIQDVTHFAIGLVLLAIVAEALRRVRLGSMPTITSLTEETAGR